MTITIENFANFDQNDDIINYVIIFLSVRAHFDSILAQQWLQMGTIGKFEKMLTSGLVHMSLMAIPIYAMSRSLLRKLFTMATSIYLHKFVV